MATLDLRTTLNLEPIEVTLLNGETLIARPSISGKQAMIARSLNVDSDDSIATLAPLLFEKASADRFVELWDEDAVSIMELDALIPFVVEQQAGRPTQEPNGSSLKS